MSFSRKRESRKKLIDSCPRFRGDELAPAQTGGRNDKKRNLVEDIDERKEILC